MISNGPLSLHGKRKLCGAFLLLAAWSMTVYAGRVLAEIEYFYADDGTLTGKAFNGRRVNSEYERRAGSSPCGLRSPGIAKGAR